MKKLLFIFLGIFLLFIGGVGITFAADPEAANNALSKITNVFVTNWPDNQKVTITGPLDSSGNLKISQTSSLSPKMVTVFDNYTLTGADATVISDYIDTDGYKKAIIYVKHNSEPDTKLDVYFSATGGDNGQIGPDDYRVGHFSVGGLNAIFSQDIMGPKLKISLYSNLYDGSDQNWVYIYLMP